MKVQMIGMEQLKIRTGAVLDSVENGDLYLVTRRGKPSAAIFPAAYLEAFILDNPDVIRGMFGPSSPGLAQLAPPRRRRQPERAPKRTTAA